MILYDEINFDITVRGTKADVKRFENFLLSGELDDFFEFSDEYISHGDEFSSSGDDGEVEMTISSDDVGIEVSELDTAEFLDTLCRSAKRLELEGTLYDIEDSEFSFRSAKGEDFYVDARRAQKFNDELDEAARDEESLEDEDEE